MCYKASPFFHLLMEILLWSSIIVLALKTKSSKRGLTILVRDSQRRKICCKVPFFIESKRVDRHNDDDDDDASPTSHRTNTRVRRAVARIRMMKRRAAGAIWLTTFWKRADRSWACVETLRCRTGFAWARGALHLARYAAYDGRDRWLCVWKPACELARPSVPRCRCSSQRLTQTSEVWVRCARVWVSTYHSAHRITS